MTSQYSQQSISAKIDLSRKQTEAIKYLEDDFTTEILYGGGAGGGKSYLGAWWLLKNCIKYPGTRWVMGRAKLKTLKETTLKSLLEVMKRCNITTEFYNYHQVSGIIKFYNESEILLKDLFAYPSDPDFDELGSLEITGAFIDEASQITSKAKNILKSRIRYKLDEYSLIPKLLMTCNPTRNFLYAEFYKPYTDNALEKGKAFVHALLGDNPHITKHYKNNLLGLDKESKERLLFGNWQYLDDPTKLCEIDKIYDLWTNEYVPHGRKFLSCDIARFGGDKTVIIVWDGLRVIDIYTMNKNKIPEAADKINNIRRLHSIPSSNIVIDDDGVGGGVVDMIPGCLPFVANKKPVNTGGRQNYANLKSQCYFVLAEKINKGEIYIEVKDHQEHIIEELEQIKKEKEETDQKLSVVKKDHVKEMIGRSPDFSDAIMMRMYLTLSRRSGVRRVN
jgi:hypothetical protein